MNAIYELKDILCDELEQVVQQTMQKNTNLNLELIDKLTHSLKSVETIIAMNEAEYGNSSYNGNGNNYSYDYGMNGSSYRGNSYRRHPYIGTDNYTMNRRNSNYSRDDGKHDMIQSLKEMMNNTGTDKERNAIMRCIEQLENV